MEYHRGRCQALPHASLSVRNLLPGSSRPPSYPRVQAPQPSPGLLALSSFRIKRLRGQTHDSLRKTRRHRRIHRLELAGLQRTPRHHRHPGGSRPGLGRARLRHHPRLHRHHAIPRRAHQMEIPRHLPRRRHASRHLEPGRRSRRRRIAQATAGQTQTQSPTPRAPRGVGILDV